MSKDSYIWNDSDEVEDHTKVVKRVWDLVMPKSYPYVKKFNTEGVKDVKHIDRVGPYHRVEHKLKYKVSVVLDASPLRKIGWKENEPISNEMVKEAYGDDYFIEMRNRMRELLAYVGLGNFGFFDFEGDLSGSVE